MRLLLRPLLLGDSSPVAAAPAAASDTTGPLWLWAGVVGVAWAIFYATVRGGAAR